MDTSLELSGKVRLVTGSGGLPRIEVTTALAEAHIYLHGAHVTHFAPTGQSPVLFMSAQSAFLPGKPIRGGVPIIFPWFGPRQNDPASPAHGFARTQSWATESIAEHTDGSI
ncbi:MAG: D-hexose-6-phosphate mutarotase, partial [Verrucomicrobiota bacterium]